MRTSIRKSICLVCGLLSLTACQKDFLEQNPSELFTPDQINEAKKSNPDIDEAFVNGAIETFFKSLQSTSRRHDDFAQKSFDICSDLMSGDMELEGGQSYGWFAQAAELKTFQKFDLSNNYSVWRISYLTVSIANGFFRTAGGDDKLPSDATPLYNWGQLKTLRALAYLNLAHFYGKPYSDETKSSLVVPINRATDESGKPNKLATLQEIYDFIIKDLTQAIEAFDKAKVARKSKQYIDATVARGALARAYMDTGNWDKAYEVADKLLTEQGAKYPLISADKLLTNGFNNYETPEFIWGIDITKDNTGSLISFWGHMDVYTYSYASVGAYKGINKYLQDQIPESDLRKGWFHPKLGIPTGKFFSTSKPKMQGDREWLSDIVFMRMAEMYLIASEAAARKGNDAKAKEILLKLLKERTKADKYTEVETKVNAMTHDQLLKEILYNWRVEMWGEGFSLTVMKRFKNDVQRSPRNIYFKGETIKWNDPRLTYELPRNETTNNPLITTF